MSAASGASAAARWPASLLLPCAGDLGGLDRTTASARGQTVPVQVVAVVSPGAALSRAEAHADEVVVTRAASPSRGQMLNAAAERAAGPIHATVPCGALLPHGDWLERALAHYDRSEVAGVSGSFVDPDHGALLEPRDLYRSDWSPSWGFSGAAFSWRRAVWEAHRFDERMLSGEERQWAWRVLRAGGVLVLDPFVMVEPPAQSRGRSLSIFRRSASEWQGLLAAGAPVQALSAEAALSAWWREVDTSSPTPARLQRLNWFRAARIAGRLVGSRRAQKVGPAPLGRPSGQNMQAS